MVVVVVAVVLAEAGDMVVPAAGNHNSAETGLCIDSSPHIDYNRCLQHHHNMAVGKVVQRVLVRMKWGKVQY